MKFKDKTTEDIFNGLNSKQARKVPVELHTASQKRLTYLYYATQLSDLLMPPSNNLETLQGDRKGYNSIRINKQWRIVFKWMDSAVQEVQIIDYH